MHDPIFYLVEYVAILLGVILVHKFVYCHKRIYDLGTLYVSVLAATYVWAVVVCMHLFGIELGFTGGIIGGGIAIMALDTAVGFLHNSGY